jgi:3',5'-nucleoside bisphosphate phosphatase
LSVPAHVDRPAFSLLANLGFVPPDLDVPALELFRLTEPAAATARWPDLARLTLLRGSDAHRLSEMKAALRIHVEQGSISELRRAMAGAGGRRLSLA